MSSARRWAARLPATDAVNQGQRTLADLMAVGSRIVLPLRNGHIRPTEWRSRSRDTGDRGRTNPRGLISVCEWKGVATYFDVVGGDPRVTRAFYPSEVETWVDDERARSGEGVSHGGWITSDLDRAFQRSLRGPTRW